MSDPNLNHLAARIAIEECVRRGCRTLVVCPGSRSAPLAVAAAALRGRIPPGGEHPVDVLVAHDERGAAFLALGAARVTGRAAAVITTSGTAVANLLPAAVEASMDGIPMLLFTADRPPELHGCGANQSVPQDGLLAPVARASLDVQCPNEPGASPLDALEAVAQAWDLAHGHGTGGNRSSGSGHGSAAGPVHVNWRFREPLAPVAVPWSLSPSVGASLAQWQQSGLPWARVGHGDAYASATHGAARDAHDAGRDASLRVAAAHWPVARDAEIGALAERALASRRGVVVAGGARSPDEVAALARVARALQWPVIADITSGLRGDGSPANVVHHADLVLCAAGAGGPPSSTHDPVRDALRPDMILRVGGRIASKRVQQWIDDAVMSGCTLAVAGDGIEPMDPSRGASVRVRVGAGPLADCLQAAKGAPGSDVADAWRRADLSVAQALAGCDPEQGAPADGRITEPMVARAALRAAHGAGAVVMLSSSMPVRDADMHADRVATPWCIANRGASGIDGIVATAAGACRASRKPALLLIGDVAALHDLASWSLLRDLPAPMCVVVVNNDGGGIFRFLPVAEHPAIYSPWFDSPHGLHFEGAAAMFSLAYERVVDGRGFADAMGRWLRRDGSGPHAGARHSARIIEVRAEAGRIMADHREIQARCASAVREALVARPVQGSAR